tara:strand:- start:1321 stop:1584 length:264 start_codon:yes stop_codon:yes gene_type:complete
MTEEERIAVIAKAVENSKSITPSQSVEEFISEIKTEQLVTEHGLLDVQEEDVADESQFLFTDVAEDVDEEDEDMGISDEMKGVYNDC